MTKYRTGISTDFSLSGLGRTLNPFSKILGGTQQQYVPKFLVWSAKRLGGKDWSQPKAAKLAHVFTKVVGSGLAAGGLFALLRLGAHSMDMDRINMAGKTPGQDLQKQYKKPVDPLLTAQGSNIQKKAWWEPYSAAVATLPPIAALLAAGIAFKKADQYADKKQEEQLDKNIASTMKDINTIGLSNIRAIRGVQQPKQKPLNKKQALNKISAQAIPAGAAFLALLLSGAGIATGYHLQRGFDPATIKYKALKKGIQQYTKARAMQGMQETMPINNKILASLDPQQKTGKAAVDQLPELNTDTTYKSIDI